MNYHEAFRQIQEARRALDRLEAQLNREHPMNSMGNYNALDPEARVQDAFPGRGTLSPDEVAAYEHHIRTRDEEDREYEREAKTPLGDVGEDTEAITRDFPVWKWDDKE